MSLNIEHSGAGRLPGEEPSLNDVVSQFDDADLAVRMAYSRYFEKPNPRRMKDLSRTTADLFDAFGEILQKLKNDTTGVTDRESRAAILATLIHRMNNEHSKLIVRLL